MNFEFLKEIGRQLLRIWREIKTYQKFTLIAVAIVLFSIMIFLVANAASTSYVALYPAERLLTSDAAEIKIFLDSERVAYQLKGDTLILVPESQVHRLRMDLAAIGIPKMHTGKGFELFDTNTWIKGEKELQIMEMRALKGQLEMDISEYENIKSVSVILDMAAPRPFGGSMYKTKASVILNLMPGARLGNSQLRAMTYHIAGAVRGLTPNMVAISDTTGKLYQALDPNGEVDMLRSAEIALEERLKSKIDGMLAMVVGPENYYSTVQVVMNRQKKESERKIYSGTSEEGRRLGDPVISSVTESGLEMLERERAEVGMPGTNSEAVAGIVAGNDEILNRSENRNQLYRQMAVPMEHVKVASIPGRIQTLSLGVLIDKTITIDTNADLPQKEIVEGKRNAELLKEEILNQMKKIVEGYGVRVQPAVDFVEFDKTRFNQRIQKETLSNAMDIFTQIGTVVFIVLVVIGMFWTFNQFWRRYMLQPPDLEKEEPEEEEVPPFSVSTEPSVAEVEAMMESIKMRLQSDPKTVIEVIKDWIIVGK